MKKYFLLTVLSLALLNSYAKSDGYNILDYGATNDGKTLTTASIQKAIDACAANGGGMVYAPKGEFLIGTLNLASNVDFHMETGAKLIATTDPYWWLGPEQYGQLQLQQYCNFRFEPWY